MTLQETLTAAINELARTGYSSAQRLAHWFAEIRKAAEAETPSNQEVERRVRLSMTAIYDRLVTRGGVLAHHPGVERFTLTRLAPKLRQEVQKRIVASADLIKLNRSEAISKTLRRFSGWATSVPEGGAAEVDRRALKVDVKKGLKQYTYAERRVLIDQGHKLVATVHNVVAVDGGAIAAEWHSHWRQPGYRYREDHKDRDERLYLIRDSWADKAGLVKGEYYDTVTAVGEEPFCRCYLRYVYTLRKLPPTMLTAKGVEALRLAMDKRNG